MAEKNTDNKIPIYQLKSKEKILDYYVDWTKEGQFNKDMIEWNYQAPQNTVKLFDQHTPNKNISILDAGCGSGLVGSELQKYGYTKITGADFSQEMLNLIPQNIYKNLELIDLNKKLKYEDNFYDAITCVGTFTYGHVKAHALDEMLRIIKKKGLICFTINEGIYLEYQFDKKMKQLSNDKSWKIIDFSKCSYIVNKEIEAWLCIAKKLN
jgi:ubiquinone/menaquinone biosynthesis C-methylase UbiE